MEYKRCYANHRQQATQQTLDNYIDSHNAYIQQLHTTNAMLETYHGETIPQLLQELEEVYTDLCSIISDAIYNGADIITAKVRMQFSILQAISFFSDCSSYNKRSLHRRLTK